MARIKTQNDKVFTAILKELLAENDGERMRALAASMIECAIDGSTEAAKAIIDRVEGKVTEKIEVSGDETVRQIVASSDELIAKIRKRETDDSLIPPPLH